MGIFNPSKHSDLFSWGAERWLAYKNLTYSGFWPPGERVSFNEL